MKYLDVCSGISAPTVAWKPLGWDCVAYSEIEKFPSAVLQHHYPETPNHGDMTDHERWPEASIDVLIGGTPCQSFSVAGLRGGMADPRGNLALVYLAIADQYRPRWLVWENVPGVLSSNEGRDFGAIIGAMVELGYSPCWRMLDAQYFGVPQRRRRVFVVASARDWRDSAQVLFEPSCLRRHPAPRRSEGQSIANALTERPDRGGGNSEGQRLIPELYPTLDAETTLHEAPIVFNARQDPDSWPNRSGPIDTDATQAVAVDVYNGQQTGDVAATLGANTGASANHAGPQVLSDMAVRRLTPLECERLQGFPDGYTDIPGGSDTARYRALGNSMAVPVISWLGRRIKACQ